MARKLRVEYPGAVYHVLNRGDRREPIFRDDHDRRRFLETLAEACAKTGWQVYAYVLMPNHFHLVLETPQANLVAGMKWFLGTYTGRFNRRHKLFGHLFSGRYKALVMVAARGAGNKAAWTAPLQASQAHQPSNALGPMTGAPAPQFPLDARRPVTTTVAGMNLLDVAQQRGVG
jgi:REP element-mobilizing transposase RayT